MAKNDMHELVERASEWPEEAQQDLAKTAEDIEARYFGVYVTDADERRALKRSEDDMTHDRFAAADQIERVFKRFHRA